MSRSLGRVSIGGCKGRPGRADHGLSSITEPVIIDCRAAVHLRHTAYRSLYLCGKTAGLHGETFLTECKTVELEITIII